MPDFWTGIAVALALMAIALLGWGFKPRITLWVRHAKQKEGARPSVWKPKEVIPKIPIVQTERTVIRLEGTEDVEEQTTKWIDKFYDDLNMLKGSQLPEFKKKCLENLYSTIVYSPQHWSNEAQRVVPVLLDFVESDLPKSDTDSKKTYMNLLHLILDRGNDETSKTVKDRFSKVIERYDGSPEFEKDAQPLILRLKLEKYSRSFMQKLVSDSIHYDYWSDDQFNVRLPYVTMGLERLNAKDSDSFRLIKDYLVAVVTDSKEDQRTIKRALELHSRLKGLRLL